MPIVKISLSEEQCKKIQNLAKEEGISIQDLIRNKFFGDVAAHTPADAVRRALAKYSVGDTFTLPALYGDEWTLKRGAAGVFGKQFFNYVLEEYPDQIQFVGMANYGRHAQYEII